MRVTRFVDRRAVLLSVAIALFLIGLDPIPLGAQDPSPAQTVGANFLGIRFSDSCSSAGCHTPPDTSGAAGPSQIVIAVQSAIRVLDKAGHGQLTVSLSNLFGSLANDPVYPRVVFDRLSGRFFVIADDSPNILLAVSSGSTITGASSFTLHSFAGASSSEVVDFTTLAVDAHAVYIGANIFTSDFSWIGPRMFILKKSSVLAGGPLETNTFNLSSAFDTPYAVSNDDPDAAYGYIVTGNELDAINVTRVSDPGGTPTLTDNPLINVGLTGSPLSFSALGVPRPINAVDARVNSVTLKNGSLWVAQNANLQFSGVSRVVSRVHEITLDSTPTLKQTLIVTEPGRHYIYPSVAVSGQNHVAVGMNVAGLQTRPSVAVAGRLATDPLGVIRAPIIAHQPANDYQTFETGTVRWGAYSETVVDPSDNMTMWTFQEYPDTASLWAVRVVQLLAPPPATPAGAIPISVAPGAVNADVVITGTSVNGSGFYDPGPGYPNRISASVGGAGVTVNSVTFTSPTSVSLNISVDPAAPAGFRTVTVTNPDGQAASSSGGILFIGNATSFQTIQASAGAHGAISPAGSVLVGDGGGQPFTIVPDAGYHIADVLVDGASVGAVAGFTFSNVTASHTIAASFAINAYTITASAGPNGSITPSGAVTMSYGSAQSFTITPNAGYHVADVLVDGGSIGPVTSYSFSSVTANHSIAASFLCDSCTLTEMIALFAECVQIDPLDANQRLVRFGYENRFYTNGEPLLRPYDGAGNTVIITSSDNTTTDATSFSGAPVALAVGIHTNAFSVRYAPGQTVMWSVLDPSTLQMQTAQSSDQLPACAMAGQAGENGVNGAMGPDGDRGPAGPQGEPGPPGLQGQPGAIGPQGEQGLQCTQGEPGPQGIPGQDGRSGQDGAQGPMGPRGEQGTQGAQGAPGAVGPQGETGPQGPDGAAGPAGPAGAPGPQGPRGERGERGLQGPAGHDGAVGAQGPAGDRGARGPQGERGAQGPAGPEGRQGPQGDPATMPRGSLILLMPGDPIPNGFSLAGSYRQSVDGGGQITIRIARKN